MEADDVPAEPATEPLDRKEVAVYREEEVVCREEVVVNHPAVAVGAHR